MGFICGHNMPGYLPDSDEPPYVFDTFDEAKRALIDDMLFEADNVATYGGYDDHATALSNTAEDVNLWSSPDSVIVCDPSRAHDLGTCYWIEESE